MYARQSIQRYRKQLGSDPKPTLMTPLFKAEGEDGLSEWDIVCEAQGYIVAGSDTTAVALTYLVYAVCRDQKVRGRLVAELATLPEDFTEQDTRELPYLGQVINETLRLYSSAPSALKRVVPPEGAYLAGYRLPGGVTVSTQAYTFHRDPTIFPDPER
jgi:cytochrome P450